jgi:hypothetical protein
MMRASGCPGTLPGVAKEGSMRKLGLAVAVVVLWAAPRAASAGPLVEGSLGLGWIGTSPGFDTRMPVNIMVAPGYGLLDDLLKIQLGVGASGFGDVSGDKFRLQLRPMVTLKPPLFPAYIRGIVAFLDVTDSSTRQTAFGGAAGVTFGLAAIGIFAEVGALTYSAASQSFWILEGRAGLSLGL